MRNLLFLLIVVFSLSANTSVLAKGQAHHDCNTHSMHHDQDKPSKHADKASSDHDEDHADCM